MPIAGFDHRSPLKKHIAKVISEVCQDNLYKLVDCQDYDAFMDSLELTLFDRVCELVPDDAICEPT